MSSTKEIKNCGLPSIPRFPHSPLATKYSYLQASVTDIRLLYQVSLYTCRRAIGVAPCTDAVRVQLYSSASSPNTLPADMTDSLSPPFVTSNSPSVDYTSSHNKPTIALWLHDYAVNQCPLLSVLPSQPN